MAEEKFRINDSGVDTDALRDAIKDSAPSIHEEREEMLDGNLGGGNVSRGITDAGKETVQEKESIETNTLQNRIRDSVNESSDVHEAYDSWKQAESKQEQHQMVGPQGSMTRPMNGPMNQPMEQPMTQPMEQPMQGMGEQPIQKEQSSPLSNLTNNIGNKKGQAPQANKSNMGGGDAKSKAANMASNMLNNKKNDAPQKEEKPESEKSEAEHRKEEKERADANNANNIRNAADVAIASKNPYAMAIGGAIKAADKMTGGKSTEFLGKQMTKANKMTPGGRSIQRKSNKLNESGMSDKIGTAASMKNGGGAGAAEKGAKAAEAGDKAQKAKKASDSASKAKNSSGKKPDPKKAKSNKEAGAADGDSNRSEAGKAFLDGLGKAILHFFLRHPFLLIIVFLVILLFLMLLTDDDLTSGNGSHRYCSYQLNGVVSAGSVKLDNVQVELVNCDASPSNYTVLETIDFEKYVVGVALAEVSWHKDYPEYFKAAIVAARGFSLRRNSGMCPSNPDNCFYGYNVETGKIRMRACTNDQVYCDIDKPCYHVLRSGQPTIYGPEAEGMSGATVWKGQLDEATKAEILAAAEEVKGKVLVDSSGNVVSTNYVNTDQNHWWELAQQGKKYDEILVEHYSSSGATGMNSATCSNYGNIDYGNYQLSSEGDTILNERLDRFLESKGTSLEEFNNLIKSNVEKNGYGTRAGVVAAAVTLIAELGNNYDTKVPYFLSGGHHDGVRSGALGYWGSGYEDDGRQCYYTGYGNVYTVCGLDCSGFVPWAIKNGGFQVGVRLAGNFQNMDGARRVSLSSSSAVLEPGDLLESEGHIVLVVGIDESTSQYICAEASGKNAGVLFTRRPFSGGNGYWGVKMDGYYEKYSLAGK